MLTKIVVTAGATASYAVASKVLQCVGELPISSRHVNKLADKFGDELAAARNRQAESYLTQRLPRQPRRVEPIPQLACVEVDGGRMQTRTAEQGPGVHAAHWRETKNAGFFRMKTTSHPEDPQAELPRCFADRQQMSRLLPGLAEASAGAEPLPEAPASENWRPEVLYRTCVSSLCNSESFGLMMAAEADARGFFTAERRAFLGDGLAYNWTIQREHFGSFTPIVDFIHPVERLYAAARAVRDDAGEAWLEYVRWAKKVWQGQLGDVIAELVQSSQQLGPPPPEADEADSRRVLAETLTYLRNNASRMDYPSYRQQGLPVTSALIESLVKEINYRVKGSEKFWNDGPSGEAILQLRAALLSDDDRLLTHIRNRPGSPYARPSRKNLLATAA